MTVKISGAIFVILACSSFGFSLAAAYLKEVRALRSLIKAVNYMKSELQYRYTALPELCAHAAQATDGCIRKFFLLLVAELESQICPNTEQCVLNVLARQQDLPSHAKEIIVELGKTLGAFGLSGQLEGLLQVHVACEERLANLTKHQDIRVRSYQTLGVCAGAALAILLV